MTAFGLLVAGLCRYRACHHKLVNSVQGAMHSRDGGCGRRFFGWPALVEPHMETASMGAVEGTQVLAVKVGGPTNPGRKESPAGCELRRVLANVMATRLTATRFQFVEVF